MKIFCSFIFISICTNVLAQISAIDTDRPDQTESVYTVPKNYLQFETGFVFQKNNDGSEEFLIPTLLSKYGISEKIELRLITSILSERIDDYANGKFHHTKLDQIELGAKISLWEEKKLIPKTSFIFHFGIPGLASYKTNRILFNSRLTMQHTLSNNISLGYNLGVEFDGISEHPVFVYTFAPGISIGKKWYAYIESFGSFYNYSEHNLNGGVAYFINNNCKLDCSAGLGVSRYAPEYFIGVGASIRFNTAKK